MTATTALSGPKVPLVFPRGDKTRVTILLEGIEIGARSGLSAHKNVGEKRHGDSVSKIVKMANT